MKRKALFLLLFLVLGPFAFAGRFTIPVLPDTQHEVNNHTPMFVSQMDWIVNNKAAYAIPIALHVGDVIDADSESHAMWKTASAGFKRLDDAGIPYAIALGNHDHDWIPKGDTAGGNPLRRTAQFNAFFPPGRFSAQRGRFEEGKSDNAWYAFRDADSEWLVLSLEPWPRQDAVDWAKTVVESHPRHNVILITHSYLTADGEIQRENPSGDLSPQQVAQQLVFQYPNVLLVLSGHVCYSARRADKGVNGNTVYQILQDYQNEESGGGYIRLLEIDTAAGTISARMYSPYSDVTKTDASQFTFSGVRFLTLGRR